MSSNQNHYSDDVAPNRSSAEQYAATVTPQQQSSCLYNSLSDIINQNNKKFLRRSETKVKNASPEEIFTMSREELDAKLAQNKAEVQAISSGMKEEMAKWREEQNTQMANISAPLSAISAKMDAKVESNNAVINGKIDSINTAISGINTAISGIQSGLSIRLTIFGIIIVLIVLIPAFIGMLKSAPLPQQPPVIYMQQPTQPNTSPNNTK